MANRDELTTLLTPFEPILLSQMNDVALLSRVEVKYVLPMQTLAHVLNGLQEVYSVLVVENQRLSRYRTLYFDTPDFALYQRHHAGARNRYKVRAREYEDSKHAFLEVKHKTHKNRTVKSRIQTPELVTELNQRSASFLQERCPYQVDELLPCLWNKYMRITLVNKTQKERVTLDLDLRFAWQAQQVTLPGVVVAEVKQAGLAHTSDFMRLMRENHIRSTGFSKYCVGVSLLYPTVKHNNFKAKQRLVAKLMQGDVYAIH